MTDLFRRVGSLGRSQMMTGIPGASGSWTNVTPAGINLDKDFGGANQNFGTQTVVADPVANAVLYAVADDQGLWKSTDYGTTWAQVYTGVANYVVEIEQLTTRNPGVTPKLWVPGGYGIGVKRSTDGGSSFTAATVGNTEVLADSGDSGFSNDVYSIASDPTNSLHLLCTFHGFRGVSESTDSGATWSTITTPAAASSGVSLYVWFIPPSPTEISGGATLSTTWLIQSQWDSGQGTWRTTNSGASWTKVSSVQHYHGSGQIVTLAGGHVFLPGVNGATSVTGVYYSSDYGVTFSATPVNDGSAENGCYATPNYIYADWGAANQAGQAENIQRASMAAKTTWASYGSASGRSIGSGRGAFITDGVKNAIVTANWNAGLWRYVE